MSFFPNSQSRNTYGVLVDIGSGSVLVAIVRSTPESEYPQILWAHREHPPLKNFDDFTQCAKAIMTALVNASMLLDAKGMDILRRHDSKAKITRMQCTVAAPWSYTVTKKVQFTQDTPFTITNDLIDDLTKTVQTKITDELQVNNTLKELDLQVIDRVQMDLFTNGYRVKSPVGAQASDLVLVYSNAVSQGNVVAAINEMHDKLLPSSDLSTTSYALAFYTGVRELFPHIYDSCLLDVTYEATEMSIMRDGVLKYSTHTPFGLYSLVREICSVTNAPLVEIEKSLQTDSTTNFIKSYPSKQQADIETIFTAYTKKLATLFKKTGDDLSIPRHITLHATKKAEGLFSEIISNAAKQSLKSAPIIEPVTSKILNSIQSKFVKEAPESALADTSMVLSAQFFHMNQRS